VTCSELKVKYLNETWGDMSYVNQTYSSETYNFSVNTFSISGFSSGGFMTSNLFAMFNENIDGVGIIAASGPCATRGDFGGDPCNFTDKYPTEGMRFKPVYIYSGTNDTIVMHDEVVNTSYWYK
jgi:poly(3-hydroxybutyrate) depolymerase